MLSRNARVSNGGAPQSTRDETTPVCPGPLLLDNGKAGWNLGPTGELFKNALTKHLTTDPRGIASDAVLWELAKQRGARTVKVAVEDGRIFTCSVETFDRYAFPINRGYGRQLLLPLGYWSCNGAPAPALQERQARAVEQEAAQLDLFGGAL